MAKEKQNDLNEKQSKDAGKSTKELYKVNGNAEDFKLLFDERTLDSYPFMEKLYKGESVEVDKDNKIIKLLIDNKIIMKES